MHDPKDRPRFSSSAIGRSKEIETPLFLPQHAKSTSPLASSTHLPAFKKRITREWHIFGRDDIFSADQHVRVI
jgi:hypothetical protein